VAAPTAYDPPSVSRSWEAFLAHVPTILLIWVATAVISVVGAGVYLLIAFGTLGFSGWESASEEATAAASLFGQLGQLPFTLLSSLVGVLLTAVPALHYATGAVITVREAFAVLLARPWRYLLAGALFTLATAAGLLLCVLPGLAVALVTPVYVNLIFTGERPIPDCFTAAFAACYGSPRGRTFVGIELLAWLVVLVVSVCTCGLGALLAVPVSGFFLQNAAYHYGLLR
jgi:hypothetical protein